MLGLHLSLALGRSRQKEFQELGLVVSWTSNLTNHLVSLKVTPHLCFFLADSMLHLPDFNHHFGVKTNSVIVNIYQRRSFVLNRTITFE
jgi:hypothetical protein